MQRGYLQDVYYHKLAIEQRSLELSKNVRSSKLSTQTHITHVPFSRSVQLGHALQGAKFSLGAEQIVSMLGRAVHTACASGLGAFQEVLVGVGIISIPLNNKSE